MNGQKVSRAGARVRMLRNKLGLTQVAFADKIGVKGGVISAWENGTAPVPYGRILIICDAYNVNERWLYQGIGDMFARSRTPVTPSREAAMEFVCKILDKTQEDARDQVIDFMRDIIARYDELLNAAPEDPSEHLKNSRITVTSADADFDRDDDEEDQNGGEFDEEEYYDDDYESDDY